MTKLDNLITAFAQNKLILDDYKKLTDKENAEIKSIMLSEKLHTHEVGDYKATVTVSQRDTINEEMLLDIIKHSTGTNSVILSSPDFGIVKVKEYIDFDALEKAIYDGKIPNETIVEMNKARESKEVVTLKVTKLKKKKGEE